jgi:AI-2 transport protein TqsA
MEVEDLRRKVQTFTTRETGRILLEASAAAAEKIRRYMGVRTQMSVATGVLVGAFAWIAGLQFALEWGVIAFALNYIPFIGPFIATLFPTLLAMAQFATWQAVLSVFVCLNVIQFVVGSYIEPRVSGVVLAISPSVVLFAVFFWTFLWGLFGAFIGVPIAIAILTFCSYHPSSRWIADFSAVRGKASPWRTVRGWRPLAGRRRCPLARGQEVGCSPPSPRRARERKNAPARRSPSSPATAPR